MDSSQDSVLLLDDYPIIMAGDTAIPKRVNIAKTIHISPPKVVTFHKIFEDPYAFPNSFELTRSGKEELRRVAKVFRLRNFPNYLWKGIPMLKAMPMSIKSNPIKSAYHPPIPDRRNGIRWRADRRYRNGRKRTAGRPYLPEHKRNARRIVLKSKILLGTSARQDFQLS